MQGSLEASNIKAEDGLNDKQDQLHSLKREIADLQGKIDRKTQTDLNIKESLDSAYKRLDRFHSSIDKVINDKYATMNERVELLRNKIYNHQMNLDDLSKKQINQ